MTNIILVTVLLFIHMVLAVPVKEDSDKEDWDKEDWDKEYESPEYTVVKQEENYEKRVYPPSSWVCTNLTVDTAQDPLAGLEDWDFREIMQSKRYKTRVPSSLMFWPLFRYINGENKGEVKISMTKGVTTRHSLIKRDRIWGDLEVQEMCFYLESKFQTGGSQPIPPPLDTSVYIVARPELSVFVRQFPGWAFTAEVWQANRDILERNLEGEENYNNTLYYTVHTSHPWVPPRERRNEVWVPETETQENKI